MRKSFFGISIVLLSMVVGLVPGMGAQGLAGAVYTTTNSPNANAVVAFGRSANGVLTYAGAFPTGGRGTGAGLGNQGALILDPDGRRIFTVNAGSDDISVFTIGRDGLSLLQRISSGGRRPISLTATHRVLYVLNAGGLVGDTDNISGFSIGEDGRLTALPGSTQPLSAATTGPAQVQFSPDGSFLVVTEKATNRILLYPINKDGIAGPPTIRPSVGTTPFGFAFGKRDQLFVSEAFGGAPDASAISSYLASGPSQLQAISPSVGTTESAACWVVVTNDGRFLYTTNTGSGTVSGYAIDFEGAIALLNPDGRTGVTGPGSSPIDMALTANSRFLYTLNSANGTISGFRVESEGQLVSLAGAGGLPVNSNGLAAR
ncbi:MAG: lactonase family protein [Acidobacteriales bacterium]|nr:lactonase family protein [Terriglobales bacterium]MCI0719004.1 lactonase family protein [Acidobacteriota bacterium]